LNTITTASMAGKLNGNNFHCDGGQKKCRKLKGAVVLGGEIVKR